MLHGLEYTAPASGELFEVNRLPLNPLTTSGELPESKSSKRKHKDGESDEELSADLSKEERRQDKKARKASRRKAREEEALAQQ
uniref:Uncharacterized protein n=1 Tax=Solanum tuberosum TaxID=4113 RepID=M1DD58_SOLTU